MAEIAVIGTGYVGLTTGAYLAHLGHNVVCADVVPEKVEALNRGEVPIHEAGLDDMVAEGLKVGRLKFVVGNIAAVERSEFVFLCLPTPQGEDGSADLSYVEAVAREIGPHVQPEGIVVNKSTVPVGSNLRVAALLNRDDVHVVSNPEFLREGQALQDSLNPDRIVIGSFDQEAAMRLAELYESLHAPVIITDPASAETIKYASNAFLATKVSFINAVAHFCELVGADIKDVALGMGHDKRIGFEFLRPGPGWGGSCFPGDETVLARRDGDATLLSFAELFAEVERVGSDGWSVLAWDPTEPTPVFLDVTAFTARPFVGNLTTVRTKMGRSIRCTPDHPFVVGDGASGATGVSLAGDLTTADWLPIAQGYPLMSDMASYQRDFQEISSVRTPSGTSRIHVATARAADGAARFAGDLGFVANVEAIDDGYRVSWSEDEVGFRRLDDKAVAWVRVARTESEPWEGTVYSVEVDRTHTVVVSSGLVAHNCFPKDSRALVHMAEDRGYGFDLLRSVVAVNDEQYALVVEKIARAVGGSLAGKTIAVWGLTFKARTDDTRESPSLFIIDRLRAQGAEIQAFDPMARRDIEGIKVCADAYAAVEGAAVLAVLTEWEEFRFLDMAKVRSLMGSANIVDARNLLDPAAVRRHGFTYDAIGRL